MRPPSLTVTAGSEEIAGIPEAVEVELGAEVELGCEDETAGKSFCAAGG